MKVDVIHIHIYVLDETIPSVQFLTIIKRRKRDESYFLPLLLLSQTQTSRSSLSMHILPRISKPFRRVPTSRRNKFSSFSQTHFSLSLLPYFFRHLSLLFTTGENSLKIRGRKVSSLPTVCPPLSTFFSKKSAF